jgi:hypothetical protein
LEFAIVPFEAEAEAVPKLSPVGRATQSFSRVGRGVFAFGLSAPHICNPGTGSSTFVVCSALQYYTTGLDMIPSKGTLVASYQDT